MARSLHTTLAVALLLAAAAAGSPATAQTAGKCVPNTVAQNWPNPTIVQFDTGKTAIKPDYQKQIAETAKLAKDHFIQQVCIRGFADKQGNADANQRLSLARAQAVAAELRKQGVSPKTIVIEGSGEPGGQIASGFNRATAADRRVEIRFTR
jgi:outer membrane protein OmpA-like peptidoglycan-associated protein